MTENFWNLSATCRVKKCNDFIFHWVLQFADMVSPVNKRVAKKMDTDVYNECRDGVS